LTRSLILCGLAIVAALLLAWALVAYFILPLVISHYEHQRGLKGLPMVTRTAQGLNGDPLNIGIVGTREEVVMAMHAAGWSAADPVTLRTSADIIGSVLLDRPYPAAPVSPLYYEGRIQDLAFERPLGNSADRRLHIRLWRVLESGREGRPVWLGSASTDTGVGLSHYTGAVTHAIAPDIDQTRDRLCDELARALAVSETYQVSGVGPTLFGKNGEGDRYVTDGEVHFSVLAAKPGGGVNPPAALSGPALVALKDSIWPVLTGALNGS